MYTYKFLVEGNSKNSSIETTLSARFRFEDGIHLKPNEYSQGITNRITDLFSVKEYLERGEMLDIYKIESVPKRRPREFFFHGKRKENISPKSKRILLLFSPIGMYGFDITVKVQGKISSLEEMLDLDALNKYILTGKI